MASPDKTKWRPMRTAPPDRDIVIKARGVGVVAVYFVDCAWLRDEEPEIADCWRRCNGRGDDIELSDATGWRPGS